MKFIYVEDAGFNDVISVLPDYKADMLRLIEPTIAELTMFVAKEEHTHNALGVIVCMALGMARKGFIVLHVSVVPKRRGEGIGTFLVENAVKFHERRKYTYCAALGFPDENEEYTESFLEHCGLKRLYSSTHLLYEVGTLKESQFGCGLDKLKPLLKKVKSVKELDEKERFEADTFLKTMRPGMSVDTFKSTNTSFFVSGGKVLGYNALVNCGQNTMVMMDMEIIQGPESEIALPAMLASIVDLITKKRNDDVRIIIFVNGNKNLAATRNSLGEESDLSHVEYWEKIM